MTPTPYWIHTAFELAAYSVGFRLYLRECRRRALPALATREHAIAVAAGAIIGAALGSKIAYWLYDPHYAFAAFPDWRHLLGGKSIVGALLGGLLGVELAKHLDRVPGSTGDAFVLPLVVGMCLGRVGCFLAGLDDHTYGDPTALPWGVDFGDGVARHPTQLYEIAFLLLWGGWIAHRAPRFARSGDRFRAFMLGYFAYRLLVEWIRPIPFHYLGALSGLQLLCLAGLLYYARDAARIGRAMAWARR